ncbi:Mov34/MPN/PAD-1 family protein [Echinicola rosea]|uniref:Peptidase n=1 Tax=Echinicola rosea TaxID=1807691 RepID=A0ABQ1VDC9_9BACT|nr:Mov34/MPN/PAD-1 family protein [Echinicola rosea]GGF50896.1 peptidase [Echinicola rosea]
MVEVVLNKFRIVLLDSVIDVLRKYKQVNSKSHESGGILLGQVKGNSIYIMRASIPTNWDKSSRNSFNRCKDIAQVIINYEFANSNQKTIYLGEWHTHPEKSPTPSSVDKKMILDQFKDNELNEPFLILVIQGIKGIHISITNEEGTNGITLTDVVY